MRCRVWKTTSVPGAFDFPKPTWVMTDGWSYWACYDWDSAMRQARRQLRGY